MTFDVAEPNGLIQDVPAAMERDATSNCTGLSSTGMGGNGGRMGDTTSFMILSLDAMVLPYWASNLSQNSTSDHANAY